jgi:hypothetical protein
MKALVALILGMSFLALAASTAIAAGVSFDLSYSDPASDVEKFWTSNMTPVLTATGNLTLSPFPSSVNFLRLTSANASADVKLTAQVQGNIAKLDNTSYEIRVYTRQDNASHFIVTYVNGTATLTSNATGFVPVDISGSATITSTGPNPTLKNALQVNLSKSLLGTITAWNIDATAKQTGTPYTYEDFIWQLPGNPGSTPTPPPAGSVLPSWIWLAIVPVVLAILAVIVFVARRKKPAAPPKE